MASYRVLPAVESGGREFGYALGQGVSSYVNATKERLKKEEEDAKKKKEEKDKEKKAEKNKSAYESAAKASGMELSGLSYDDEGKGKYTYKTKEDPKSDLLKDPGKTIKRAMLGIGDLGPVGEALDVPKPKPMAQDVAESLFPVGNMTGSAPSATGGPMDYGKVVQKSLKDRFAPGVDNSVISRDLLGLPQEKEAKKDVPPEFSNDVMALKKISADSGEDSTDVFMTGLQKLSMKYIDNPLVLARIKLIIQALNE